MLINYYCTSALCYSYNPELKCSCFVHEGVDRLQCNHCSDFTFPFITILTFTNYITSTGCIITLSPCTLTNALTFCILTLMWISSLYHLWFWNMPSSHPCLHISDMADISAHVEILFRVWICQSKIERIGQPNERRGH